MSSIPQADKNILRALAQEIAEAAQDPVNETRRDLARRINNFEKVKPLISIYQEPWNELGANGELELKCTDDFCRGIEGELRRRLYKWRTYPGDMVMNAVCNQAQCISDTGFGIREISDKEHTSQRSVASRHFHIQIANEDDITKIKEPVITHDAAKTEELFQKRSEIFDGILKVGVSKRSGFWFAPWDELCRYTGVQEVLLDMAMRPDYVHKAIGRMIDCWLSRLDQLEAQDLLSAPVSELTTTGAAQIFSEVSPAMHEEFALRHEARFYKRFKKVYYGCCEPLDNKVDICAKMLPNLYKISMSPWINFKRGAENVGNRFIFAWKPNPAVLAHDEWNPDAIRKDMKEKLAIASANDCIVEIHLKDISTVRFEPQRLTEWNEIAQECTAEYV